MKLLKLKENYHGHVHYYKGINAEGHHVWMCKVRKPKCCRGYALTDGFEEDASLLLFPTGHNYCDYSKFNFYNMMRI